MKPSTQEKIDLTDKQIADLRVQAGAHKKTLSRLRLQIRALTAQKVRAIRKAVA